MGIIICSSKIMTEKTEKIKSTKINFHENILKNRGIENVTTVENVDNFFQNMKEVINLFLFFQKKDIKPSPVLF